MGKASGSENPSYRCKLLSPLFAYTLTPDRFKSFICIHIAIEGGGGGCALEKNLVDLGGDGPCGDLRGMRM
jgi:hypothetical protein